MYGFEITVTPGAGQPDSLSARLDEITNQLAIMCAGTDEFKGYMITERQSGGVTFLITTTAHDEVQALSAAISWLHSAVHAVDLATPGWLKRAEQVFDDTPTSFDGTPTPC
jgi:hypothetical protein